MAGVLAHGHTFGGHPLSAAIALRNLDIFARDRVVENVQALERGLAERMESLRALSHVADVRFMGFVWSVELVKDDAATPFTADEARTLVREVIPQRLVARDLIAKRTIEGPRS
jgi:adenosylmethionine-8-amino-7-oxononanoate aminotransferase